MNRMYDDLTQTLKDRLKSYKCTECGTLYELGEAKLTNKVNRIEAIIVCPTCEKASPTTFVAQD